MVSHLDQLAFSTFCRQVSIHSASIIFSILFQVFKDPLVEGTRHGNTSMEVKRVSLGVVRFYGMNWNPATTLHPACRESRFAFAQLTVDCFTIAYDTVSDGRHRTIVSHKQQNMKGSGLRNTMNQE